MHVASKAIFTTQAPQEVRMAEQVQEGQYWLAALDSIVLVLRKGHGTDYWVVNELCKCGGRRSSVYMRQSEFYVQLNPMLARKKALEIMQAAMLRHLQFS